MKNTLLIILVLLIANQEVWAQVSKGVHLQFFSGLAGDARGQERTYSSFDTDFTYRLGWNYGIGLAYQYSLARQWGLSVGVSYENNHFTRGEYYEYLTFREELRGGNILRTFRNQSILFPVKLLWRPGKWGFNFGMVPNIHLQAQMTEEHFFYLQNIEIGSFARDYQSGQYEESDPYNWERTELEKAWNLQWSLGIAYQILPRLSMDLTIRDFLFSNQLSQEVKVIDVVGTYTDRWDAFARSVNLGMTWQFSK